MIVYLYIVIAIILALYLCYYLTMKTEKFINSPLFEENYYNFKEFKPLELFTTKKKTQLEKNIENFENLKKSEKYEKSKNSEYFENFENKNITKKNIDTDTFYNKQKLADNTGVFCFPVKKFVYDGLNSNTIAFKFCGDTFLKKSHEIGVGNSLVTNENSSCELIYDPLSIQRKINNERYNDNIKCP